MRVLIADDHELVRDTLAMFLDIEGGIASELAGSFEEASRMIEQDGPFDVVLLDFNMPGMNGLEGLRNTLDAHKGQRVALISGEATRDIAEQALELGAAGFIPKSLPAKSLVNAVRFMAMGERYAPVEFMTAEEVNVVHPLADQLTKRELQVLRGLTEGKTNKQIARDLKVQEPTVKLHIKNTYRKIGAPNRTVAALLAQEAGLFKPV
jgi:DNA-binding NarL/FixJ family response regulator